MYGLMGGTETLWSGSNIPVTIIGEYDTDDSYTGSSIWYDAYLCSDTTSDGGAYQGFMGGIDIPSAVSGQHDLEGKLIALYIDPSGNAGYLRGNLNGAAYPDIKMFEMDGLINRQQVKTASEVGISAEDLIDSTYRGSIDAYMAGGFTGGGRISGGYYDYGYTLSIVNWDTNPYIAQNWGIYGLTLYGEYENPQSTWTAKIGGYGDFGIYYYYDPYRGRGYWNGDSGYFIASIDDGTVDLTTGKLTGTVDGRFITYTKLGTIEGDLLGTANADNT
ncbi:MAG: hypothetical protein ACOYU0_00885 [Nitrospirota bacterium]